MSSAPRKGLECWLMETGHTGPLAEPRRRLQAGKSGDPHSVNTDNGVPHSIITDNGSNFMADEVKTWCANLGIKLDYASVYHPQTNG